MTRHWTAGAPWLRSHVTGTGTGGGGGGGGTNTGLGTVNSPGTNFASSSVTGGGKGGIVTIPLLYDQFAGPPEAEATCPGRLNVSGPTAVSQ